MLRDLKLVSGIFVGIREVIELDAEREAEYFRSRGVQIDRIPLIPNNEHYKNLFIRLVHDDVYGVGIPPVGVGFETDIVLKQLLTYFESSNRSGFGPIKGFEIIEFALFLKSREGWILKAKGSLDGKNRRR